MNENKGILEDLAINLNLLDKLEHDISAVYSFVKREISICKKNKIPLMGNPLVALANQFIELNYQVLQHICNCKIYVDFALSCDHDPSMDMQIEGLLIISGQLRNKYKCLRDSVILPTASFVPKIATSA